MSDIKKIKEEKIKDEVVVASQRLFQRFGYHKTTMEDIAQATGRGKSTLYYYYKSKEEIFGAIVLKEANDLFSVLFRNVDEAITAEEKLKVFLLTAYRLIREKAVLNDVVLGELMQTGRMDASQYLMNVHIGQLNEKWRLAILGILQFGVENKEFCVTVPDELEALSHILMISLVCIIMTFVQFDQSLNAGSMVPVSDLLTALVDILINGLK